MSFIGLLILASSPVYASNGPDARIANPASVYCEEAKGYETTIVDAQGESGFCAIGAFGRIETWTLFSFKQFNDRGKAVRAYLNRKYAAGTSPDETQWAAETCACAGGQLEVYTEKFRPDTPSKMCAFDDNSRIEAWTLFMGPEYSPELAQLLKKK